MSVNGATDIQASCPDARIETNLTGDLAGYGGMSLDSRKR